MMLLEVTSLKKGIICSDISENIETIWENALYFKSGHSDSLAEKMDYAVKNMAELDALRRKAFNWIVENRKRESITGKYLDLYQSI